MSKPPRGSLEKKVREGLRSMYRLTLRLARLGGKRGGSRRGGGHNALMKKTHIIVKDVATDDPG